MMGPVFAVFRPIAAFITGIVGGAIANITRKENHFADIDETAHCDSCEISIENHSAFAKIKNMLSYAFGEFLDDISFQLVIGVVIAGFISFIIPDDFFLRYGGQGFVGMLFMIAVGIPLYVCATGSIPIAVSLMAKGISPGAAFVFLVAGPATNAATIALIARALGKKMVTIYLSVIAVFALLGGIALNYIYPFFPKFQYNALEQHHEDMSFFMKSIIILFSVALFLSLFRKLKGKFFPKKIKENFMQSNDKLIQIEGMTCNHCVHHVTEAIKAVSGVENVSVSLAEKRAIVSGNFELEAVHKAIQNAGYKVK
jgi:copper chaperone CopZ